MRMGRKMWRKREKSLLEAAKTGEFVITVNNDTAETRFTTRLLTGPDSVDEDDNRR